MEEKPTTVSQMAPDTSTPVEVVTPPPVRKTIERQGSQTVPVTRRWPQVRGGVCEFCGILDPNTPSEHQYKLCPHFRDIGQLVCSYCPAEKDPNEVIGYSKLNIAAHPDNPDKLIVWCDSYKCSRAHEKRFMVSAR